MGNYRSRFCQVSGLNLASSPGCTVHDEQIVNLIMNTPPPNKPLGAKAYGSICHLPGSRLGPGDHKLNPGQARILTQQPRDKHDVIIVQEKLDGSNVAVARLAGQLLALGRAGYPAITSPYEQHKLFATGLFSNLSRFDFLEAGECLSGE